jgi:hypothetical protein
MRGRLGGKGWAGTALEDAVVGLPVGLCLDLRRGVDGAHGLCLLAPEAEFVDALIRRVVNSAGPPWLTAGFRSVYMRSKFDDLAPPARDIAVNPITTEFTAFDA